MSTLKKIKKIDFHDRGPPGSNKGLELAELLGRVGQRTYMLSAGGTTQIDLQTDWSELELQRFIVDNFQFIGEISIDDKTKICQEAYHHGNANISQVAAE